MAAERVRARVLIVDDHDLARAGLRELLSGSRDLEIVGEARDGQEAISEAREQRPDLILMDVRMPDMDGLTATRRVKAEQPGVVVLMFTLHEDPNYLLEAMEAGAAGYLLKGATRRELLSSIRAVLRGESVIPPNLAAQVFKRLAGVAPAEAAGSPAGSLTAREQEVLVLLTRGYTNRRIAEEIGVSPSTVKAHVEHIIGKLNVSDRTQAAVRAVQTGLVPAEPPIS